MAFSMPPELAARLLMGSQSQVQPQMQPQMQPQVMPQTMMGAQPPVDPMIMAMGAGPGKTITDIGLDAYHRNAAPYTKNPPKGTLERMGRQLFGREVQRGPTGKFGGTPRVAIPSAYNTPIMQGPRPPIGGNVAPMGRIDDVLY